MRTIGAATADLSGTSATVALVACVVASLFMIGMLAYMWRRG